MSSEMNQLPGEPLPVNEARATDITEAPASSSREAPRSHRRWLLPLLLFLATCVTTYRTGGLAYAAPLMTILVFHEFGHYIQARRYRVPASLPYFIPIPGGFSPLGTMGAVIGMSGHMGDRRALFDIGITGPLAGLAPALVFSVIGLKLSTIADVNASGHHMQLGEPILYKALARLVLGELPPGKDVFLHQVAYAGWVGFLVTSLNLFPIGQLDGGHILYAILRKKAHIVASLLLACAIAAVLYTQNYGWVLMLGLLVLIGPNHPPTANDEVPLGTGRIILGWLTLCFLLVGFTPVPFSFS